jgi:hypothetical protein
MRPERKINLCYLGRAVFTKNPKKGLLDIAAYIQCHCGSRNVRGFRADTNGSK